MSHEKRPKTPSRRTRPGAGRARGGAATLHRSATNKVFGGVAGGIAERFDVDANIVRVVFVVLTFVYGLGIAIYLAMWALIPRADHPTATRSSKSRTPLLCGGCATRFRSASWCSRGGLAALHNMPALGMPFAILWLIFLVVIVVLALFTPARRLTFRRLVGLLFLAGLSFLILLSGVFLITIHEIGVPVEGGSGVKQWVRPRRRSPSGVPRRLRPSTIDLLNVPFSASTWTITATQGVGVLIIDVPRNVSVALHTHVGIGWIFHDFYYAAWARPQYRDLIELGASGDGPSGRHRQDRASRRQAPHSFPIEPGAVSGGVDPTWTYVGSTPFRSTSPRRLPIACSNRCRGRWASSHVEPLRRLICVSSDTVS